MTFNEATIQGLYKIYLALPAWYTYSECLELLQSCPLLERDLLPGLLQSGHSAMHQTNGHCQERVQVVVTLAAVWRNNIHTQWIQVHSNSKVSWLLYNVLIIHCPDHTMSWWYNKCPDHAMSWSYYKCPDHTMSWLHKSWLFNLRGLYCIG